MDFVAVCVLEFEACEFGADVCDEGDSAVVDDDGEEVFDVCFFY